MGHYSKWPFCQRGEAVSIAGQSKYDSWYKKVALGQVLSEYDLLHLALQFGTVTAYWKRDIF